MVGWGSAPCQHFRFHLNLPATAVVHVGTTSRRRACDAFSLPLRVNEEQTVSPSHAFLRVRERAALSTGE
jgi:hypothetical protein